MPHHHQGPFFVQRKLCTTYLIQSLQNNRALGICYTTSTTQEDPGAPSLRLFPAHHTSPQPPENRHLMPAPPLLPLLLPPPPKPPQAAGTPACAPASRRGCTPRHRSAQSGSQYTFVT